MVVKNGAGYFFISGGYGLLIKRRSKHNDKAWDLAGGNVDPTDTSLEKTALREATEELGLAPDHFKLKKSLSVVRGKHGQKHYTAFLAEVPEHVRDKYEPQLSEEHSDWHWFKLDGLVELHNYQAKNGIPNEEESPQGEADDDNKHHFPKHLDDREDGKTYIKDRVKLHPWVFILLNKENRDQWLPLFKSQSHSHVPSTESANKEDGDYEQVGSQHLEGCTTTSTASAQRKQGGAPTRSSLCTIT